jgi:hypothetical protein
LWVFVAPQFIWAQGHWEETPEALSEIGKIKDCNNYDLAQKLLKKEFQRLVFLEKALSEPKVTGSLDQRWDEKTNKSGDSYSDVEKNAFLNDFGIGNVEEIKYLMFPLSESEDKLTAQVVDGKVNWKKYIETEQNKSLQRISRLYSLLGEVDESQSTDWKKGKMPDFGANVFTRAKDKFDPVVARIVHVRNEGAPSSYGENDNLGGSFIGQFDWDNHQRYFVILAFPKSQKVSMRDLYLVKSNLETPYDSVFTTEVDVKDYEDHPALKHKIAEYKEKNIDFKGFRIGLRSAPMTKSKIPTDAVDFQFGIDLGVSSRVILGSFKIQPLKKIQERISRQSIGEHRNKERNTP